MTTATTWAPGDPLTSPAGVTATRRLIQIVGDEDAGETILLHLARGWDPRRRACAFCLVTWSTTDGNLCWSCGCPAGTPAQLERVAQLLDALRVDTDAIVELGL